MKGQPNWEALGQGLGTMILGILSILMIFSSRPWMPFLDNANLLIHESGHLLFSGLGEFVSYLGGSLMQLLVPAGLAVYFKVTKQNYAAAFCLFWLGESLVNLSIYIKDARTMFLPLVNNGTHDWNWILGRLHLLPFDGLLGNGVYVIGLIINLIGVGLAARVFYLNAKKLNVSRGPQPL